MVKRESHCVQCGQPCLGSACPYGNAKVVYCDFCGSDGAEYTIDGQDFCEDCAKDYLQDAFDELTIREKAKLFGLYVEYRG